MNRAYLLYLAYYYWTQGEPVPVDLFIELNTAGYDPSELVDLFENGYVPEGDELVYSEEDDD